MKWDPDTYVAFADERTRPAVELLARIPVSNPQKVIDLGCGPGNSTALLVQRWPDADVEGLESSPEMLAKARSSGVAARWTEADLSGWSARNWYDVVFSNASLHWVSDHPRLLPSLMSHVTNGGALAFQVPCNFHSPSHRLLKEVAVDLSWSDRLKAAGQRHVESADAYFDILASLARKVDIWETVYLHVLEGDDPVLRWVSGTALRPFLEPLDPSEQKAFTAEYSRRLREAYPRRHDGKTLFPFRRLFVVALR